MLTQKDRAWHSPESQEHATAFSSDKSRSGLHVVSKVDTGAKAQLFLSFPWNIKSDLIKASWINYSISESANAYKAA